MRILLTLRHTLICCRHQSPQLVAFFEDLQPQLALWPAEIGGRRGPRLIELKSDEAYFPHIIRLIGLLETPAEPAAVAARAVGLSVRTWRNKGENP